MNYRFVPFSPDVRRSRARREATLAERLPGHLFGWVELTYLLGQPVHVGSGYKALREQGVVRLGVKSGGTLVIPGSSIKGMLRGRFEAITKSCALWPPAKRDRTVPVLSRSRPDIRDACLDPRVSDSPVFRSCGPADGVCPACALFGYQTGRAGQQGRVAVADFASVPGVEPRVVKMPAQYGPRLHHLGNSRPDHRQGRPVFVVETLYGRKFHIDESAETTDHQLVESLPSRTRVCGRIRFFNLTPVELGGLLTAAGWRPQTLSKVGGGKGVGFGVMRLLEPQWEVRDSTGTRIEADPSAWRTAFEGSDDRWRDGEEALVALYHDEH